MLPGLKFLLVLLGIHNGVDREQSQTGDGEILPKLHLDSGQPPAGSGLIRSTCSKYRQLEN